MNENVSGNDLITEPIIEETLTLTEPEEEILFNDTVSGSDVRTETELTPVYIDYTELLESIDGHLEEIETISAKENMNLMEKPFDDYNVSESLCIILLIVILCVVLYNLITGR